MKQVPLLFFGDAPFAVGGLSRIGRDIATVATNMDEFRVGFLGRGGMPSVKFPWMQYNFPEEHQWGENWLEAVWHDFARDDTGIVMTIWDPSRLMWFSDPEGIKELRWLKDAPFRRWGYFPIDHEGPNGKLTITSRVALEGYNRLLAYGEWGSQVIYRTLDMTTPVDWLPHGIDMESFKPCDGKAMRVGYGIGEKAVVVGCVMTNQWRKDWGLACEIIFKLRSMLKEKLVAVFKVDSIDRYWDLRALIHDIRIDGNVIVDIKDYTDKEMAHLYSMCNITMLPSLGEGFGYPIVESLACGVPVVHGSYGGGAELVPSPNWLVAPEAFRYDTRHNCRRPVYDSAKWVNTIMKVLEQKNQADLCRASVAHLDWTVLHVQWKKWFRKGLEEDL